MGSVASSMISSIFINKKTSFKKYYSSTLHLQDSFLKELKINLVQSVKNQEMENEGLEREINRINKIDRLKV